MQESRQGNNLRLFFPNTPFRTLLALANTEPIAMNFFPYPSIRKWQNKIYVSVDVGVSSKFLIILGEGIRFICSEFILERF